MQTAHTPDFGFFLMVIDIDKDIRAYNAAMSSYNLWKSRINIKHSVQHTHWRRFLGIKVSKYYTYTTHITYPQAAAQTNKYNAQAQQLRDKLGVFLV
ncbi:hypothetical protein V3I05_00370 [Helicobacter mastomyrinus]|uniref:Uncharacterized protein n=1 Tax=Helicobacter mastomyrinus TaxID=287948 RepID=A0ABZ3F7Z2_9HELI